MLIKLKKLRKIPKEGKDILVIDEFGSNWINECIPGSASYQVIPLGSSIPYILRPKFFFKVLLGIFQGRSRFYSLYESLIETLKPKVIISFTDNNTFMGNLQKIFPKTLVISVQNGLRTNHKDSISGWDNNASVPHYYGFGNYEEELITEIKVNIEEYVKAGSLKLGLALSQYENKNNEEFDICFISQFRYPPLKKRPKLSELMLKTQKELFRIVLGISLHNKLKMSVALASNTDDDYYQNELDYFKGSNLHSQIKFIPNNRASFNSYKIGFSSKLIIALWSTLSIELFGAGKRAIFGGLLYTPRKDIYTKLFENMPSDVLLYEQDEDHIRKKIDSLLKMTDEQYLEKTAFARNYYMRCERPYPHEMIKKRIADHLNIPAE